jgi:PAS domain S-box-containing protein
VQEHSVIAFDESGHPLRMTGAVQDITQRKLIEKALRESEERFRTAFRVSPDAININRLTDGIFVDTNEGFTETTGYTREEVIGKSSLDINIWVNPKDREALADDLMKKGYINNLEAQFRMKNGIERTGLMSARLLSIEGELFILSVTRDIADRKKVEEALRESERNYRTIVENVNDAIYIFDFEGNIIDVNENACRWWGIPGKN